jgi:RNA polymerase sigma-70 factor (ECF subfamily)
LGFIVAGAALADSDVLFATHRDGVFRYLSRIVGPREAPDLTQEVFLRVSRASVPQDSAAVQRAWLFRIARNLALNHRRDTERRPITVALTETSTPAGQELAVVVRQALDQLTPIDRDVFLLREAAGLTYDEIALACDLSSDAVRSRLHRARQTLRACLTSADARPKSISLQSRPHDKS